MYKWSVNVFLLSLLLVGLVSVEASAQSLTDVAYVLEDASTVSSSITHIFDELDLSYDVIRDSEISTTDFSDYGIILVVEDVDRAAFLPIGDASLVFFDRAIASMAWSTGSTGVTINRRIEVESANSFIFTDVTIPATNEINVYSGGGGQIQYLNAIFEQGVEVAATRVDTSRAVIAYKLDDVSGEKELFFGLRDPDEWREEAEVMFLNAMIWMFGDIDLDGDGFVFDVDCNDNDEFIHPGAPETPYDGIDQDCDGSDLNDVDLDGYVADFVGGLDCDDGNASINPDNLDLALNCINDAPEILDVGGVLVVDEGQNVVVEVLARDPEGNSLTYSVEDGSFFAQEHVLIWETGFEDAGEYEFLVVVSDGELEDSAIFFVEVLDRNQPPVLTSLPDFEWNEDTTLEIDLADYFSDSDNDLLSFGVETAPSNSDLDVVIDGSLALFTPAADWFGEDSIEFFAFDGFSRSVSNVVGLRVVNVNDPVFFIEDIPDITFLEDQTLENALDLNEYFFDGDSVLDFSVSGSNQVAISIVDGFVSFVPSPDYFGREEITFTASDGEFEIVSNVVQLEVLEQGEPPVFASLDCTTELAEDVSESCRLNASDVEGDAIEFFVVGEDNLECVIDGDELRYVSVENYVGVASCVLEARDIHGSDFVTLEVVVSEVNDAPEILSSAPESGSVHIVEGNGQTFVLEITDPEGDSFSSEWFLDGESVFLAEGANPIFDLGVLEVGSYNLRVVVSDGELSSEQSWTLIVGPISDFTCSEVDGFVFAEGELCSGEILGVHDSDRCCSLAPVPKFADANSCELLSNEIVITLEEPRLNDEFELGDTVEVEVDFLNDLDEDQDYDVELHLYNLDEDDSVVDEDAEIEVRNGRTRLLKLDLEIPEDLDLDDRYALLVTAEDAVCNQVHQELQIQRRDNHVVLSDFELPREAVCGDEVLASVEVENLGADDQDVRISLSNNDLDLEETSEAFQLERYDDEDSEEIEFSFVIPDDVESGEYPIEAVVSYRGRKERVQQDLSVSCEREQVSAFGERAQAFDNGVLLLNQGVEHVSEEGNQRHSLLLVGLIAMMELLLISAIGIMLVQKRKVL